MLKRIIAFYDVLLYALLCSPLIVNSIILLIKLVALGTHKWIYENWYLVIAFAISFVLPIAGTMLFRYCLVKDNFMHFHYFPFALTWEKANNNIDVRWNQDIYVSEVKDIKIVKLTQDEKETKVFYRHWFNKYLKITLHYGKEKYVYVGNYSNHQIKKIIKILTEPQFR